MTVAGARIVVIALTLAALCGAVWRAPFEYRGWDEIKRLQNGQPVAQATEIAGLHHAPAWTVPTEDDVERAIGEHSFEARSITLSGPRLALTWAAIIGVGALLWWLLPHVWPVPSTPAARSIARRRAS